MQHFPLAKSNDVGLNLNEELYSFTGGNLIGNMAMTGARYPMPPNINPERYYSNSSQAGAWKNIYKLGDYTGANANFIFTHDREKRHGYSRVTYQLPNGKTVLVEEEKWATPKSDDLQVELRYNKNSSKRYFNNLLELRGCWVDERGVAKGNTLPSATGRIDQRKTLDHYQIENTVYNIHRSSEEGRGVEMSWSVAAASAPHRLRLSPGLYPGLLNGDTPYSQLTQHVEHRQYYTRAKVSVLRAFMLKYMRVEPTLLVYGLHHYLNSSLSGTGASAQPLGGSPFVNDLRYTRFGASLSPDLNLYVSYMNLQISLPLSYSMTLMRDPLPGARDLSKGRFLFTPSVSTRFIPFEDAEMKLGGGLGGYARLPRPLLRLHSLQLPPVQSWDKRHVQLLWAQFLCEAELQEPLRAILHRGAGELRIF